MRLLKDDEHGGLSLVEKHDRDIPRYAILSHTWGADGDEVTFKDLTEGTGRNKAGYKKLEFCRAHAASDGLQYFWVDTCCIDKTSSAELSEAINSMYRWYKNADKCYVYLFDVSMAGQGTNRQTSRAAWERAFQSSRWFSRGWTLQELIAPSSVEFFSRDNDRLGSKESLEQDIHMITGIAIEALRGRPLIDFSVEERLAWAKHRNTKRQEDKAYSLLGIFSVYMSPRYGEGEENAFKRLRRKIVKPLLPPSPSSNVPFRRDEDFVDHRTLQDGRTLLEQIEELCAAPAARVALVGIGGVGKSELAIEYCHRLRERSRDTWVFWIDASNVYRIEQGYREIAEQVKLPSREGPMVNIFELVARWLRDEAKGRWVLILDNLDDDTVLSTLNGQLRRPLFAYLPQSQNGVILITTRMRSVATKLVEPRDMIMVNQMTDTDAITLLRRKLDVSADDDDLRELTSILGYMPLAIVQAAANIQEVKYSVPQYIEAFRRNGKEDDDIASIRSVDSLSSTTTGSSKTMVGEVLAGANEFVDLLLEDQTVTTLLNTGFNRIKADKLERNMKRLLKLYAVDLRQEANGNIEKEAVQLILLRASYIAYRVRQRYNVTESEERIRWDRLIDQSPDKRALLENYIKGRTRPVHEDGSEDQSESSTSSEVEADQPELNDLDRVKIFMIESAAYQRFRQNLRHFILPRREPEQHDPMSTNPADFFSLEIWRRLRMKWSEAINGLQMLSRPLVPQGHKRITWICGCGDHRYADVREYELNGASTLEAILRRSVATGSVDSSNNGASTSPRPPPLAHLPGSSTVRDGLHDIPLSSNVPANRASTDNATDFSTARSLSAQPDHMFLLLCATFSGASTLDQLSIRDLNNDQYLWNMIRERYYELRDRTLWHQKLAVTRWLSTIKQFSSLVRATDLTKVKSIEFVHFQLVPIGMEIRPWSFYSPSFPPEAEVRVKKTYHYFPCPVAVDPTSLNGELLHCLWKPGQHLDRFWLDFFPKKLSGALQYTSSRPEMNAGWGIHVIEGINWATVTYLAFVLVSVSAIFGIVYSTVTHDVGGGFGMAAFLGTLPALGVAMLQLRQVEL